MVCSDSRLNAAGAELLIGVLGCPVTLSPFPHAVAETTAMRAKPAIDLREERFTFAEAILRTAPCKWADGPTRQWLYASGSLCVVGPFGHPEEDDRTVGVNRAGVSFTECDGAPEGAVKADTESRP